MGIADAWAQAYGPPAASSYTAPATTNYGNLQAGIGQDVLSKMKNTSMWAPFDNMGAAGQWGFQGDGTDRTLVYHPGGQGPGEQYPTFDPNTGAFKGYNTGSGIQSYLSGVLSVAGAGLGMGAAFGGAGAGGYAAGGLAGGGGPAGGTLADAVNGGGMLGDTTAGGYGGDFGSTASAMGGGNSVLGGQALGNFAAPSTGALGAGGALGGNSTLSQVLTKLAGGLAGGGGGNGQNPNLGNIISGLAPLLGGVSSAVNQGNASGKMIDWLNNQQQNINNTFAPGSPEFNNLWNEMSAKDAAAGRNSQYGPRAVDLATKLAQMKMDASTRLSMAFAKPYQDALNQNAGKYAGLTSALGAGSQNGSLASLINMLTGGGMGNGVTPPNPDYVDPWGSTGTSLNAPFDYGNTGDLSSGNFTDSLGSTNYFDPASWSGSAGGGYGNIDVSSWF